MLNSTNHNSKKYIYWKRKKLATKNKKQKTGERTIFELTIWILLKLEATKLPQLHGHRSNSNISLLRFDHPSIILICYACNQKILFQYFYWLYCILDYVNQVSTCSSCVYYDHFFILPRLGFVRWLIRSTVLLSGNSCLLSYTALSEYTALSVFNVDVGSLCELLGTST